MIALSKFTRGAVRPFYAVCGGAARVNAPNLPVELGARGALALCASCSLGVAHG
jgi:hypothetical protein